MLSLLFCLALQESEPIPKLILQLGSKKVEEREAAAEELKTRGGEAVKALWEAADGADPEVVGRARLLLEEMPARDRYDARLQRLDKEDPLDQVGLAEFCMRVGLYRRALEHFLIAGNKDERLANAMAARREEAAGEIVDEGVKLTKAGDSKGAEDLYELVLKRLPDGKAGQRAKVLMFGAKALAARPEELYQEAYRVLIKGDRPMAERYFRLCLEKFRESKYMTEKVPPSGKTRLQIVKGLLGR